MPGRSARLGSLEQGAAIDGSNVEDAATKHAAGKNESQTTMPSTLAGRNGQHDNPKGEDADEKGQYTASVSEQLVEADMGAWTDRDDTMVNRNATPPPPRHFLRRMSTASDWQKETLTQIWAISSAVEASEAMRSELDQTYSEVKNQTPSISLAKEWRSEHPSCPDSLLQS